MLEGLTVNLIASCLVRSSDIGIDKVRNLVQRKRYSEDVDVLATEFTNALKATIEPALTEHARNELSEGKVNWTRIAEELDERAMSFEDEQEAVVHITDGIGEGLDIDLDNDPVLQDAVKAAVADAYQTTIRAFADRLAGTDGAEVFNTQANIELTAAVDTLADRLTALQRRLSRHDIAALRNAGFIRLDPLYFEHHEPDDPETAWRAGFDFVEVKADYPLPRERPATTTDKRQSITDEVFERLDAGENLAVIGEGGSGKSTVCKQIACQWCDDADRGVVLYHGRETTASFDEPGTLIEAVRAAEDELLVVVEDAPSGDATAIYETIDEFEHASDVAFLLDARTSEWRDADDVMDEASYERQRQQLGIVEMPALDERECQRAIDHYETLTGGENGVSAEQLYEEVRSADIGGPLVLAYRLTGPAIDSDQPVSALHADVRRAYTAVEARADGEDLQQTVAVMVNILNAAELPVEDAFLHALADNRADHRTIDRMVGFLEGSMLEQAAEGVRTPHPLWSALYLERMLQVAGERISRDRFEQCVDTLFRLVDDEACREQVRDWVRNPPDVLEAIIEAPDEAAGRFVRQIIEIGTTRLILGTLYGTPETWPVSLPELCPVAAEIRWFTTRGYIHFNRGSFDAAQAELDRLDVLIESMEEEIDEAERRQSIVLDNRGTIAWKSGDLTAATGFHKRSLVIAREINDRDSVSQSLVNLGVITHKRGDLDAAEEYLAEALDIAKEDDNRQVKSMSLTNLGVVAGKRGDLKAAEEYYERALAIHREIDNRHGISGSLGNLGNVAKERGDLEAAEEYHKEALAIDREMGIRHSEAQDLVNLGQVIYQWGDLEVAKEHFKQSLDLFQEIGARQGIARSFSNLGNVAKDRGDLKAAEEYHKKSLVLLREIGDRRGEAGSLTELGLVAKERGDLEAAEEYYKKALTLEREIGDRRNEAERLTNLGEVVYKCDDLEAAKEYLKQSHDILQEIDAHQDIARSFMNLGLVAKERGDLEAAKEYYEDKLAIDRERGDHDSEAHTLGDLGQIEREQHNLEVAEEHFKEAIGIFRDIDNTQCRFHVFDDLIDVYEQQGAIEDATEWCEQAIELADQAEDDTKYERFQKRRSELDDI